MSRVLVTATACALVAAAIIVGPASGASAKVLRGGCDISGQEQDLGASYVTSVKAKNTSCGRALKIVSGYNACRKANGGSKSRTCPDKVEGFSCKTTVLAESPAQFDAQFTCTHGSKKVKGTYTQNI